MSVVLVPSSWGAPLSEFNPCHTAADGTFAPKGQGQCEGGGTSTKDFQAWFKGSKVVDANGQPLRLYHGTNAQGIVEFKAFSHFGTAQAANDRAEALYDFSENVVKRDPGAFQVIPVYLNIRHPLRMPDLADIDSQTGQSLSDFEGKDDGEDHYARGWESEEAIGQTLLEMGIMNIDDFEEHGRDNREALEWLRDSTAYDGIVYRNVVEDPGNDSYIIFNPSQVRSAIRRR